MSKKLKRILLICLCLVLLIALVPALINLYVISSTKKHIYSELSQENVKTKYDCILVLGAGIRNNSTPSDMLKDRLDTAIELYENGVSDIMFLSGDRSGEEYDEVTVMRKYCIEAGIPEAAIICDYEGYSTYESVLNLWEDGRFESIVIVTQSYHLYRALYIAKSFDIYSDGVSSDVRSYRGQSIRSIREYAARVKDFFAATFS